MRYFPARSGYGYPQASGSILQDITFLSNFVDLFVRALFFLRSMQLHTKGMKWHHEKTQAQLGSLKLVNL